MKKTILTTAMILAATSASALELGGSLGAERNTDTSVNSLYGSVSAGIVTLGATMEDKRNDQGSFSMDKYEVDITYPFTNQISVYVENDFDSGFNYKNTVIGGKISF